VQHDNVETTGSPNLLEEHNRRRRLEIEAARDRVRSAHQARRSPPLGAYPLPALTARIAASLSDRWGKGALEPHVELIERAKLGGDVALRFPQLLRDGGPKAFIANHLPWIVETLSGPDFAGAIAKIEVKGMYINLTLGERWLIDSAQSIVDTGDDFGRSDTLGGRTAVVDYSSPNVAKTLHAGHIRSTIIGHVLSNLLEACGSLVYRVNHINDFGGFGFTLEGYKRFHGPLDAMSPNDRLIEIYRIRRTAERAVAAGKPLEALDPAERGTLARYFPEAGTIERLAEAFREFTQASDERFARLEAGGAEEVDLWREMVGWSLRSFDEFYDGLAIRFDFVIGESFYFSAGDRLVDRFLADGRALVFKPEDAEAAVAELDARLAAGEIEAAERDALAASVQKDVGAIVIPLDKGERLVVRRADGRSIYATRDLGAIAVRREIFDPTDSIYVVGQEQQVHFDRLFRAAYITGLAEPSAMRFEHVYFGFYVDEKGRKLSSRDSVAGVTELLAAAVRYFRGRVADRAGVSAEELDQAARELAIGSLVFNDLKQDVKGPVEVDSANLEDTVASFERSGAAYVVYAACRARSILRRWGRPPEPASSIAEPVIDEQEAQLLLKLQQIPQRVAAAAAQSNPSLLVRHLLEIASVYNSYYTRAPVLTDDGADPTRLLITAAVQQALVAALELCHIRCPAAI
jgi:arginyl-tRNA synthetase